MQAERSPPLSKSALLNCCIGTWRIYSLLYLCVNVLTKCRYYQLTTLRDNDYRRDRNPYDNHLVDAAALSQSADETRAHCADAAY